MWEKWAFRYFGPDNAAVAMELLNAGREWRQRQEMTPGYPERELQRQIEELKRRGLETGEDIKPRLLELRRRHHDMTGASGG